MAAGLVMAVALRHVPPVDLAAPDDRGLRGSMSWLWRHDLLRLWHVLECHVGVGDALAHALLHRQGRVQLCGPIDACGFAELVKRALGEAADAFFGQPSAAMTTFAVTGTNGKTTVTSMPALLISSENNAS